MFDTGTLSWAMFRSETRVMVPWGWSRMNSEMKPSPVMMAWNTHGYCFPRPRVPVYWRDSPCWVAALCSSTGPDNACSFHLGPTRLSRPWKICPYSSLTSKEDLGPCSCLLRECSDALSTTARFFASFLCQAVIFRTVLCCFALCHWSSGLWLHLWSFW